METLLSGIFLAFISAITFVAYKHPKSYPVLQLFLLIGVIALLSGAFIWDLASEKAFVALVPHIPKENLRKAYDAWHEATVLNGPMFFGVVALAGYILILRSLPWLLSEDDEVDDKDKPKD